MKGRKPKPISQQLAEGDPRQRGKKKLEAKLAAEPKATGELPPPPKHLRGHARAAWNFWSTELRAMKLSKRPDAHMLEGACWNYQRAIQAEKLLDTQGLTVEEKYIDDEGNAVVLKVRKHPAVEIRNQAWRLLRSFASEFGLSPISRMRLVVEKSDDGDDDLMKLLSQPREPQQPSVN